MTKYYFIMYDKGVYDVQVINKPSRRQLTKYLMEAEREGIKVLKGRAIAMFTDYKWTEGKESSKILFRTLSKLKKRRWWVQE